MPPKPYIMWMSATMSHYFMGYRMWIVVILRPRLHEQTKPPLIAQILDPYEVTPDEFAQIKHILFAHVNAAQGSVYMSFTRACFQR